MKINQFNFFKYTIIWLFLFLLGNYIGKYFYFIYLLVTIIYILNFLQFIITINSIYYYQNFSTEHPFKGQLIDYKLTIENRSIFYPCHIIIEFSNTLTKKSYSPTLYNNSTTYYKDSFKLPYRGIYRVGVDKIKCFDTLNIVEYNITFWPRNFYVYPQIIDKYKYMQGGVGYSSNSKIKISDSNLDFLDTIKPYEHGNNTKMISWKHYAAFGEPYIKKYYAEEISCCNIFLDRTKLDNYRKGPVDDISIEILISLIKQNLTHQITTNTNIYNKSITTQKDFEHIYKDSIYINFEQDELTTYNEFIIQNYNPNNKILIITNLESNFLFDIKFIEKYPHLTYFVIQKNLKNDELLNKLSYTTEKLSSLLDIICVN